MKVFDFTHAVNLRRLNTQLHAVREVHGQVAAELTHFAEDQHYGYGRNGASHLVSFKKTAIDVESIYLHRPRGRYLDVLIYSRVTSGQSGFGRRLTWRLIYKKDGKQGYCDVYVDSFRSDDTWNDCTRYLSLFDDVTRARAIKDRWAFAPDENLAARVRLARKGRDTERSRASEIFDALQRNGVELLAVVPFTHRFGVAPKYVKQTKSSLELGWETNGTYGSLPCVLKLKWTTKSAWKSPLLKTVRLRDIGAEVSGYYDHSENQEVASEQVRAVKAFTRAFRAAAKRGAK